MFGVSNRKSFGISRIVLPCRAKESVLFPSLGICWNALYDKSAKRRRRNKRKKISWRVEISFWDKSRCMIFRCSSNISQLNFVGGLAMLRCVRSASADKRSKMLPWRNTPTHWRTDGLQAQNRQRSPLSPVDVGMLTTRVHTRQANKICVALPHRFGWIVYAILDWWWFLSLPISLGLDEYNVLFEDSRTVLETPSSVTVLLSLLYNV